MMKLKGNAEFKICSVDNYSSTKYIQPYSVVEGRNKDSDIEYVYVGPKIYIHPDLNVDLDKPTMKFPIKGAGVANIDGKVIIYPKYGTKVLNIRAPKNYYVDSVMIKDCDDKVINEYPYSVLTTELEGTSTRIEGVELEPICRIESKGVLVEVTSETHDFIVIWDDLEKRASDVYCTRWLYDSNNKMKMLRSDKNVDDLDAELISLTNKYNKQIESANQKTTTDTIVKVAIVEQGLSADDMSPEAFDRLNYGLKKY